MTNWGMYDLIFVALACVSAGYLLAFVVHFRKGA